MKLIGLTGLISIAGLVACSSDYEEERSWQELPLIEATLSAPQFQQEEERATRSWVPPTSYLLYDDLYESGVHFTSLTDKAIDVFFTTTTEATLHGRLRYSSSQGIWKFATPPGIDPTTITSGDYYAYGFIPREAAEEATLSLLDGKSSFDDGAVLTIKGLESVAADACVIIGAKEGPDADHDGGLRAGDFQFHLDTGKSIVDGEEVINKNYLYFLFDHLCSALCVSMKVDGEYDALRTIKLKQLYLQTKDAGGIMKKKTDVRITLEKNGTGANPITGITFTPTGTEECYGQVFEDLNGLQLTTSYSMFMGHFMPYGVTDIVLTSIYDIYDKKATPEHPEGNLIRQNCSATNTIALEDVFASFDLARRGWRYNLNITIEPTYLYVLSEPDLDSPTMKVE